MNILVYFIFHLNTYSHERAHTHALIVDIIFSIQSHLPMNHCWPLGSEMWLPHAVDGRLLVSASTATVRDRVDASRHCTVVWDTECKGCDSQLHEGKSVLSHS